MRPNEEGRKRAAELVLQALPNISVQSLADRASLDPSTVRDFLEGTRWPHGTSRSRIEDVAGLPDGALEAAARNTYTPASDDVDPVEAAIEASDLTRSNKFKLLGIYVDMLEQQEERGRTG